MIPLRSGTVEFWQCADGTRRSFPDKVVRLSEGETVYPGFIPFAVLRNTKEPTEDFGKDDIWVTNQFAHCEIGDLIVNYCKKRIPLAILC